LLPWLPRGRDRNGRREAGIPPVELVHLAGASAKAARLNNSLQQLDVGAGAIPR
jgi:hypothetical protein